MSFAKLTERRQDIEKPISLLSIDKVSKKIDGRSALSNLSLSVGDGEIFGLIGKHGSGKAIILDLISGYLAPNSGRIFFGGQDVTELPSDTRQGRGLARSIAAADVVADFTVNENIAFGSATRRRPLFPRRGGGKTDDAVAHDLLEMIGLADFAERRAAGLNPSQRRMLGIAAALAAKPSLLLLDLSPDDTYHDRVRIAGLLAQAVGGGISVLVTSHQMCPIIAMCDRAALLSGGKIVAESAPPRILKTLHVVRSYFCRLNQRVRYGPPQPFADAAPRPA